jgi:adenylate cyclase
MASDVTMAQTGETFAWRELDAVRVKGRDEPVKIYEPLAENGAETAEQRKAATAYAEGLERWRARDFDGAARCFERVAERDPPAALFGRRARALADHPPPPDWTPVNTLEGK